MVATVADEFAIILDNAGMIKWTQVVVEVVASGRPKKTGKIVGG